MLGAKLRAVNCTTAFGPVRGDKRQGIRRMASRFPEKGLATAVGDEDLMAKQSKNIANNQFGKSTEQ